RRQNSRLDQSLRREPERPDGADLSRVTQPLDGCEDVLEVRGLIECRVQIDDVDAFDIQAGERAFDRAYEIDRAEPGIVCVRSDANAQDGSIAQPTGSQPLADDVLAAAAGVSVGRMDRVSAEVHIPIENRVTGLKIDVPPELRRSQHERERVDA